MKYNNIIFDLDNTILDFDYAEEHALKNLLEDYNIQYNEENLNIYRSVNRPLWRKLEKGEITREELFSTRFPAFFRKFNIDTKDADLEKIYRGYLAKYGTKEIPGAFKILKKLKNNNYNLYLATNGFSDTQKMRIKNANIENYFNGIFISEEIGYEKPSAEFFNYLFEKANLNSKDNCIMIGDNETSDILGANNFNIDSILFNHKNSFKESNATYVVDDLPKILDILGV